MFVFDFAFCKHNDTTKKRPGQSPWGPAPKGPRPKAGQKSFHNFIFQSRIRGNAHTPQRETHVPEGSIEASRSRRPEAKQKTFGFQQDQRREPCAGGQKLVSPFPFPPGAIVGSQGEPTTDMQTCPLGPTGPSRKRDRDRGRDRDKTKGKGGHLRYLSYVLCLGNARSRS